MLSYAREHLADFKVPQFIAVRNEPLPRNPGGKVLKATLRKTAFDAQPGAGPSCLGAARNGRTGGRGGIG